MSTGYCKLNPKKICIKTLVPAQNDANACLLNPKTKRCGRKPVGGAVAAAPGVAAVVPGVVVAAPPAPKGPFCKLNPKKSCVKTTKAQQNSDQCQYKITSKRCGKKAAAPVVAKAKTPQAAAGQAVAPQDLSKLFTVNGPLQVTFKTTPPEVFQLDGKNKKPSLVKILDFLSIPYEKKSKPIALETQIKLFLLTKLRKKTFKKLDNGNLLFYTIDPKVTIEFDPNNCYSKVNVKTNLHMILVYLGALFPKSAPNGWLCETILDTIGPNAQQQQSQQKITKNAQGNLVLSDGTIFDPKKCGESTPTTIQNILKMLKIKNSMGIDFATKCQAIQRLLSKEWNKDELLIINPQHVLIPNRYGPSVIFNATNSTMNSNEDLKTVSRYFAHKGVVMDKNNEFESIVDALGALQSIQSLSDGTLKLSWDGAILDPRKCGDHTLVSRALRVYNVEFPSALDTAVLCQALGIVMENPGPSQKPYLKVDSNNVIFYLKTGGKKIIFNITNPALNTTQQIYSIITFLNQTHRVYLRTLRHVSVARYIGSLEEFERLPDGRLRSLDDNSMFNPKKCLEEDGKLLQRVLKWLHFCPPPITPSKTISCDVLDLLLNKKTTFTPTKPYMVLDKEYIIMNTRPLTLFNIEKNINDEEDLCAIAVLLKTPNFSANDTTLWYKINSKVRTRSNFPHLPADQYLDTIPATPPTTPPSSLEIKISRAAFRALTNKMSKTLPKNSYKEDAPLIALVPKENILKNGKDIRMYHGTNIKAWDNIKTKGIQPVGGGTLGKGFYFTPSVTEATRYFKEWGGQSVLIELVVKNADQLLVGEFTAAEMSTNFSTHPIMTQTFTAQRMWQFIVRAQLLINEHFRIDRAFIIEMS